MRTYIAAIVLLLLPSAGVAQNTNEPTDFDLAAAYCYGGNVATKRLILGPALQTIPKPWPKKVTQAVQKEDADLARLRAYFALRVIDSADPLPYAVAEKRGEADVQTVLSAIDQASRQGLRAGSLLSTCPNSINMSACEKSFLDKNNATAAAALTRIHRCSEVIDELPF